MIDNSSRECVLLDVGFRLTSQSVVNALHRVGQARQLPSTITVDQSTVFISLALDEWAHVNRVTLSFTHPRRPTCDGLCESLNGWLRDECPNIHGFKILEDVQRKIEVWRYDYNDCNPHSSLGNLSPNEFK